MEILQGCENSQPGNFVGCEFSQHAKFPRLLIFATCEILQVANFRNLQTLLNCVPVDYFLTNLLFVLYKFALM